jgi:hypothetical protein
VNQTLFSLLLQPLEAVWASSSPSIDQKALSQKLFYADFVRKLLFAYVEQVSSLRQLSLELKTNRKCQELGLRETPFSTLKDGFCRFPASAAKTLFETVLREADFKRIRGLDEIGLFQVIEGSLFPTLLQMRWSAYRKKKNAFKLRLNFELNRMIPTAFFIGGGNSSERTFLLEVVTAGVTYIADRGYASFEIVEKLLRAEAHFIFRVKDNLLYEVQEVLCVGAEAPGCFRAVRDEIVVFQNDKYHHRVRQVYFEVAGSKFKLLTNRLDISTLQVIILYAYRWQIELFFKYVKRTLKGLHLFNHGANGVQTQFYLPLTVSLLLLRFKQQHERKKKKRLKKDEAGEANASEWLRKVSEIFYESWKSSKNWLLTVKNSLSKAVDNELLMLLDSC